MENSDGQNSRNLTLSKPRSSKPSSDWSTRLSSKHGVTTARYESSMVLKGSRRGIRSVWSPRNFAFSSSILTLLLQNTDSPFFEQLNALWMHLNKVSPSNFLECFLLLLRSLHYFAMTWRLSAFVVEKSHSMFVRQTEIFIHRQTDSITPHSSRSDCCLLTCNQSAVWPA